MHSPATGLAPQSLPQLSDTIVAPATAPGPAARAIVRVTGPDAVRVIVPLTNGRASLTRGRFLCDFVLPAVPSLLPVELVVWLAPRTYTGQDLVELHFFGSPPLVDVVVAALLARGARLAQPGEFTMRAFLAGKLDLTQAEAVPGVIAAHSKDELQSALRQLAGGLGRPLHQLRDELLALLAEIEAGLDFADEDLTFIAADELRERLRTVRQTVEDLRSQLVRRGISGRPYRVVLAGLPNAGKSSLFNALVGTAAAIVSPEAGTTRDYLTARLTLDDAEIELIDTAGEEAFTEQPPARASYTIHSQSQEARRQQLTEADLVLRCRDSSERWPYPTAQATVHELLVATKCDIATPPRAAPDWLATSAKTGQGLEALRSRLAACAREARRPCALAPSWSRCHRQLEKCLEHVGHAVELASQSELPELLAFELRSAVDALGEMVGAVYTDDLLDRIFSQFCIGK